MKQYFRIISIGLLLSLTLLLWGCTPAEIAPTTSPAIRGSINARSAGAGGDVVGSILVEGEMEPDTSFDKAAITITGETKIFEQVGQGRRPVTFEALQMGQTVEAWFIGPVAESYPVQARASDIVILK